MILSPFSWHDNLVQHYYLLVTGIHPSWTLCECKSRIFVVQVWHCQFDDGMYRLLAVFSESEIEYLFLLAGLDKMKLYSFPGEEKRRREFTR